MVQEGSYIYDRARFVQHNLWVTKYDAAEKFAAGDYMYQSADVQGLPRVHRRRRTAGEHRRRALVHAWRPPRRPAGGLAGDAMRVHGLSPQAARLLRRQSRTGHSTVTAEGLPPPLGGIRCRGPTSIRLNSRRCSAGQSCHQPVLGRLDACIGPLQQFAALASQLSRQRATRRHARGPGHQAAVLQPAHHHVHRLRETRCCPAQVRRSSGRGTWTVSACRCTAETPGPAVQARLK